MDALLLHLGGKPLDHTKLCDVQGVRGLYAIKAIAQSQTIFGLPLATCRTSHRDLDRLRSDEASQRGLVPLGIDAALKRCAPLLPGQTAHVLLLALGILADLRDRSRALQPDIRLLPYIPGSPLSRICTDGSPDMNVVLFSAGELAELQCAPLAVAINQEKQRLASLHSRIFPDSGGPAVSLQSFVWAHCLVRSRALSLSRQQSASGDDVIDDVHGIALENLDLCMIPGIDLCNHPSRGAASAAIRIRLRHPHDSIVELVATRDLEPEDPVTLSYGERPLRDFLRGYSFIPQTPHEVFEDFGGVHQALLVIGETDHNSCSPTISSQPLVLQEILVLGNPGDHPVLDFGQASLLYVLGRGYPAGVRLSIRHCQPVVEANSPSSNRQRPRERAATATVAATATAAAAAGPLIAGKLPVFRTGFTPDEQNATSLRDELYALESPSDEAVQEDVALAETVEKWLDSDVEAAVCESLSSEAALLLQQMNTTLCEDESTLASLQQQSVSCHTGAVEWSTHHHMVLALQYRMARKKLLLQMMDDMTALKFLVSF